MLRLLVVVSLVALGGCATPTYNYTAPYRAISEPPVGSVSTVRIGDVMLKQGKYREHDAVRLTAISQISWGYTLHPGVYLKHGDDSEAEYFLPSGSDDGGRIEKALLADQWKSVMAKRTSDELCIVTVFNVAVCRQGIAFERLRKAISSADSFQQTLIYNGRVGSKINVAYREFSNNVARPAFNNSVEYDLSESTTVGYKGAELEILEATNQHIRFRLLRNFNDGL